MPQRRPSASSRVASRRSTLPRIKDTGPSAETKGRGAKRARTRKRSVHEERPISLPIELQGSPESLYEDLERFFGEVPEAFRAMERRPDLLAANWAKAKATLFAGELPLEIKALIGVVVSAVRGSTGTLAPFLRLLISRAEVERPVLAAVMENRLDDPALSALDSAILTFARAAAADLRPSREGLRAAGLDDAGIFEVVATVDLATSLGALTDGLGVEPDLSGT